MENWTDFRAVMVSPVAVQLGWTLVHSVWEGAVICGGTATGLWLLRRRSAAARYAMACGAMAVFVTAVAATFVAWPQASGMQAQGGNPSDARSSRMNEAGGVVEGTGSPTTPVVAEVRRGHDAGSSGAAVKHVEAGAARARDRNRSLVDVEAYLPLAVVLWIVGVAGLSLWRIGGWVAVQRLRTVGTAPVSAETWMIFERVLKRTGVRRAVGFVSSVRVDGPLVLGFIKPLILIPPALVCGLSTGQLEAVLAHELAHVRRHDYLALLLQSVVETLLFYHPGVWWLSRRIGLEREQCCDDLAAAVCGDRRQYAGALAALEEVRLQGAVLGASGNGARELMLRIGRLMGVAVPAQRGRGRLAIFGAVLVMGLVVSLTMRAKGQAAEADTLTVTVTELETGKALAGVGVHFRGKDLDVTNATDEAGKARLRGIAGRDYLAVSAGGGPADAWARAVIGWRPTAAEGAVPAAMELALEKGMTISGQVVDQEGKALAGARVAVSAEKQYAGRAQELSMYQTVMADDQGRWKCAGVPEKGAAIEVGAVHPECLGEYGFFATQSYPDAAALFTGTAKLTLTRGVMVEGIVRGPDGRGVPGAAVEYGNDRNGSNMIPPTPVDETGKFKLGILPGVEAVLTVKVAGYAPELVRIKVGTEPMKVTIDLKPPVTVAGRVVDGEGRPVAGSIIVFDTWREARTITHQVRGDSEGRWQWDGAPSDPILVDVLAPGFAVARHLKVTPGAENTLTVMMPTHFHGTVVDAATGEAVKDFRVRTGISNKDGPVSWDGAGPSRVKPGEKAGAFETTFDEPYDAMVVRVEADGYMAADSAPIAVDGKESAYTFKLKKGARIAGKLLDTQGKALAGAEVFLVEATRQVQIDLGTRLVDEREFSRAVTDAEGQFTFVPQKGAYRLLVVREDGVAVVTSVEFEKTHTVELKAWARVEGTVRVGTHAAPPTQISAGVEVLKADNADGRNMVYASAETKSDAAGNFVLRIYPGTGSVGPSDGSQGVTVKLEPGGTTRVQIGGHGRPVVGKLGTMPGLERATIGVDIRPVPATIVWSPPAEVMELPRAEAAAWWEKWQASDEGKRVTAEQAARTPGFGASASGTVSKDGTFRIEDVDAGERRLIVNWMADGKMVAQAIRAVTVAQAPGGVTDEVQDVGVVMPSTARELVVGDVVPAFQAETLDGKVVTLADYQGKVLVINPWRTSSAEVLPSAELRELWKAHQEDRRLAVLGVVNEYFEGPANAYVKARGLPWPSASRGDAYLLSRWFPQRDQAVAWVIGPDGKVLAAKLKPEEISAAVDKALGAAGR